MQMCEYADVQMRPGFHLQIRISFSLLICSNLFTISLFHYPSHSICTSAYLHIYSSAAIYSSSHYSIIHGIPSAHPHICTFTHLQRSISSHYSIISRIPSAHPHICTSTHLQRSIHHLIIRLSAAFHLHIRISAHLLIYNGSPAISFIASDS